MNNTANVGDINYDILQDLKNRYKLYGGVKSNEKENIEYKKDKRETEQEEKERKQKILNRNRVQIKLNRQIFQDMIHGRMNKYQVKILLYLLHNKPKNMLQLAIALNCRNQADTIKQNYESLKHYKLSQKKMVFNEIKDNFNVITEYKEYPLVSDDFRITSKVLEEATVNFWLHEKAFNFCCRSKKSLLQIRMLLVCIKFYNKIRCVKDLKRYLCFYYAPGIEKAFLFLRDKIGLIWAKVLKKIMFRHRPKSVPKNHPENCLKNEKNSVQIYKRKEAKENIVCINTSSFFPPICINKLSSTSRMEGFSFKPEDGRKEVMNLNELRDELTHSKYRMKKQCFPKIEDDDSINFTLLNLLPKNCFSTLNKLLTTYVNYFRDPFSNATIGFVFAFNDKKYRIYNPFYEMEQIFRTFENIVNEHRYKVGKMHLNRASKGYKRIVRRFYFNCKNNQLDPVLFIEYLNIHLFKKEKKLYFDILLDDKVKSMRMEYATYHHIRKQRNDFKVGIIPDIPKVVEKPLPKTMSEEEFQKRLAYLKQQAKEILEAERK